MWRIMAGALPIAPTGSATGDHYTRAIMEAFSAYNPQRGHIIVQCPCYQSPYNMKRVQQDTWPAP